jgi:hypothetical protein
MGFSFTDTRREIVDRRRGSENGRQVHANESREGDQSAGCQGLYGRITAVPAIETAEMPRAPDTTRLPRRTAASPRRRRPQ